jgi:hypothetical protein
MEFILLLLLLLLWWLLLEAGITSSGRLAGFGSAGHDTLPSTIA